MTTISAVIADDHPIFRDGLRTALHADGRVAVLGEAADGEAAIGQVLEHNPDVVLMDLAMPVKGGVEAIRRLSEAAPRTAVLVLTMAQDDDSLFAAMKAGARGYLLKGSGADDVVRAALAVAQGEAVFGPEVADRVLRYFTTGARGGSAVEGGLTGREREVLDLVAAGLGNQAIARRLTISPKTVRNHVANVVAKLHVADRGEAVARGREMGLGHL